MRPSAAQEYRSLSESFFGHPRGLATLFFTEMWERFTYYGMRALLVLFLVSAVSSGGLGLDDRTATAIYGLYTAGTFLICLPGGWIADRLIGARAAVLIGGVGITLGNALLAMSTTARGFYAGLAVIALGVGLLKPNVSAIVAELYPEGGSRLDAGFMIFYVGINLGSTIGPLVTSAAQDHYGPRAGFGAAAIVMAIGVLQFLVTQSWLGSAGRRRPQGGAGPWIGVAVAAAGMALLGAALLAGLIPLDPRMLAGGASAGLVGVAVLYFAWYFSFGMVSADERRHGVVLVVLFAGCALFWAGYEQAGSSLNLFAERYTLRVYGAAHDVIPASWFQSLNPAFIILFAPLFTALWTALARRHREPSAPAKFGIGLILMGAGFVVMAVAALIVASGSKVLPTWLVMTYLLHTFGELCLSPVGLSYYTKLAPKRYVGQMMGMWFLALSIGNLLAGLIAGEFDADDVARMPSQYLHIVYFAIGSGVVLLLLSRPVKRLMGRVQ